MEIKKSSSGPAPRTPSAKAIAEAEHRRACLGVIRRVRALENLFVFSPVSVFEAAEAIDSTKARDEFLDMALWLSRVLSDYDSATAQAAHAAAMKASNISAPPAGQAEER
jgi:hypothetical protein